MKKKDLDKIKALLLDEKKKILRHLEDLSESAEEELSATGGDSVDLASMEISQASMQKIGKRELYLAKKIDYALEKIDQGTFGLCEECGEDISVARLMARPVAQLCIDCKTMQESVERRYSDKITDENDDPELEESEDD